MSNLDSELVWLHDLCKNQKWFVDIGMDPYNRYVVYVNSMVGGVCEFIPDRTPTGKQILCHFADSRGGKNDYVSMPQITSSLPLYSPTKFIEAAKMAQAKGIDTGFVGAMDAEGIAVLDRLAEKQEDDETEKNVQHLTNELDRLEKICGCNILGDIFFEIHDKENAVTNLSSKYPDVRERLQSLYNQFGFDILYEELEL